MSLVAWKGLRNAIDNPILSSLYCFRNNLWSYRFLELSPLAEGKSFIFTYNFTMNVVSDVWWKHLGYFLTV